MEPSIPPFSLRPAQATVVDGGQATPVSRELAVEAPLALRVENQPLATLWRTPGDDESLAVGFLLTEGLIRSLAEVREVRAAQLRPGEPPGTVDIYLADADRAADWQTRYRRVYSSCGLCGSLAVEDIRGEIPPLPCPDRPIRPDQLAVMARDLRARQAAFDRTGGVHGVALFAADGTLLAAAEDIGRHNAVDKVVGQVARAGGSARGRFLLVSGRLSFEIVTKAARVGIPFVAGVSAPTDLAVSLAHAVDMTLVGFLRGDSMTVYTSPSRIDLAP